MVSAGKNGTVYLVNRDNMGGYNASKDPDIQSLTNIFPNTMGIEGGNFGSPVYWNSTVYFAPVAGAVQAFRLSNGLLSTSPTSQSSEIYNGRGGTLSVSQRIQQRDPLGTPDERSRPAGDPSCL